MARVGRFVTDPKVGAYCQITLDSGEKIVVNHDKGDLRGGRLTIEVSKLMGFSSQRIFACDLDSPEGHAALAKLTGDMTRVAQPGEAERPASATPLGAVVDYVKNCGSVADVKARCAELLMNR